MQQWIIRIKGGYGVKSIENRIVGTRNIQAATFFKSKEDALDAIQAHRVARVFSRLHDDTFEWRVTAIPHCAKIIKAGWIDDNGELVEVEFATSSDSQQGIISHAIEQFKMDGVKAAFNSIFYSFVRGG